VISWCDGWDGPDVADVKGHLRMVDVCRGILAAALPPLPEVASPSSTDHRTCSVGRRSTVSGAGSRADRSRSTGAPLPRTRGRRHRATAVAHCATSWDAASRRAAHGELRSGDEQFRELVLEAPEVRMLRNAFWPRLTPSSCSPPTRAASATSGATHPACCRAETPEASCTCLDGGRRMDRRGRRAARRARRAARRPRARAPRSSEDDGP
jgi:hypothetical protein